MRVASLSCLSDRNLIGDGDFFSSYGNKYENYKAEVGWEGLDC